VLVKVQVGIILIITICCTKKSQVSYLGLFLRFKNQSIKKKLRNTSKPKRNGKTKHESRERDSLELISLDRGS